MPIKEERSRGGKANPTESTPGARGSSVESFGSNSDRLADIAQNNTGRDAEEGREVPNPSESEEGPSADFRRWHLTFAEILDDLGRIRAQVFSDCDQHDSSEWNNKILEAGYKEIDRQVCPKVIEFLNWERQNGDEWGALGEMQLDEQRSILRQIRQINRLLALPGVADPQGPSYEHVLEASERPWRVKGALMQLIVRQENSIRDARAGW